MKNRGLPLSDNRNRPSAFHTAVMMLLIAVMTAASVSGKTPALFRIEAYGKETFESEADGLSEKKLVLKDPTDGTVYASYEMNVGDLFSIQFIHSVNKSSVTDWFEIRDDGIYGIKTVYYGFGAGVPTQLEEGQTLTYGDDGSMIISGFEMKMNHLIYRVGTVSDHILTLPDETQISLRDLCGRNARVEFQW